MSRKARISTVVVGSVVLVVSAVAGFLAAHAGAATPQTYTASATLKATSGAGRGVFTGSVSSPISTRGTLTWKLTFTGLSGPATSVQLRQGSKVLTRLCIACKSGVHKSVVLRGATFKAVSSGKTTIAVVTRAHPTGELVGALKLKATSTGGGGVTVPVTPALVALGKKYAEQFSCTGCHTITGAKSTGPTWKGLAGSTVHLTDGTTTKATDSYLIGVITDPPSLKVQGYDAGVMSEVIAPGEVSNAEARAIVAYIKSLK